MADRKKRSVLTLRVNASEKNLLTLSKRGGSKGDLYSSLYVHLQRYFDGKIEPPQDIADASEKISYTLWFDLDQELEVTVRNSLWLCNYSDEVKLVIKNFLVDYLKGKSHQANKSVQVKAPSKKSKKPKKPPSLKIEKQESDAPPKKSSSRPQKIGRLEFRPDVDSLQRLTALAASLEHDPDVSPGGGKHALEWAETIEKYVELGVQSEHLDKALEAAADEGSFVFDFIEECPYLKTLSGKALLEAKLKTALAVDDGEGMDSGDDSLKDVDESDFTAVLLGMTIE